jgi:hypothetical protein
LSAQTQVRVNAPSRAKGGGSGATSSPTLSSPGPTQHYTRPPAPNVVYGQGDGFTDQAAGGDVSPIGGFSFSRVSVLGLQRKCACGGIAGPSGECSECRRKRILGLQTKLTINDPGDAYEQEADRVAEAITGRFSHPAVPKSEDHGDLKRPAEGDLTKGGERLAPNVAEFFETHFGHDFGNVRVHAGEPSNRYNDAIDAYAFTYGSHIWLGPGLRQQPSHILAHELAHVVQQTQPPPLESSSVQPDLAPAPQVVQRFAPYWMPEDYKVVGAESHAYILPQIGEKNGIFTEAPVPNADKLGSGFDKKGIADLYQASTTVGVFFAGEKLPKYLRSNRHLKYKGKRFSHIEQSAPRADEKRRSVIRAGSAPTEIFLGDLKPSHGTIEAWEGPGQIKSYQEGFAIAQREVNEMPIGIVGFEQTDAEWQPLTTGIIDFEVPAQFQEPIAEGQEARRLKLMHNGRRVDLSRSVMGKVYVRPDPGGGGIWNYTWAPTTRLTAADLPGSVTGLDADITARIIRPLLVSPVQTAKKARPGTGLSSLKSAPRRIQARERAAATEEAKDPFDKVALDAWNAEHKRLTGEEKRLQKTSEFKEAEFESLAVKEREAAIKSGFTPQAVTPGEKEAAKTIGKIRFWTGASSAVFGRLRYWFGGAFVKVFNAYHSIRDRFQKLLESKKSAPKKGGLLGTVIRIGFDVIKIAGRLLVERTAQHLVDSLKTGVAQKLKSLIPEDKVEDFESKVKEIETMANDLEQRAVETVEALVGKTIGSYAKHIETISEVADKLSLVASIVDKVRWGARVLACLSPPGWGCLWILAQSVIEKFAAWLIDNCWFKQQIAPLVTGNEFVAELPGKLAGFIIEKVKSFLPKGLGDVFANIAVSEVSTKFSANEICDKNDYPTTRDRDLVEKLALAELRKEIGEEKWQAWTKVGELYGVNRGEPLTEGQVEQLKKELKKATVAALKDAADLHTVLSSSSSAKEVMNLTTFLAEVERVKNELYGGEGAGGGEGGKEGIQVSAAEKEIAGDYALKFRFQVVGGVGRKHYVGSVIKVDFGDVIRGTPVTLEGVEVIVRKRVFNPNERNPEKVEVHLEATRDQYFDVEKKYGTKFVDKIGVKRFKVNKGSKKRYTLQLGAGKPGR